MTHATERSGATIDLDAPRPAVAEGTSSDHVRDWILAGATVLGPLLMIAGMLLEVDEGGDDASGAEMLTAIAANGPDRFYASNFLAAIGLALLGAGGLTVMRLVRARGGALATAGGVLSLIAGAAAASGLFMYGAVVSVMTSDGLDREAMGALQDELSEAPQVFPAFGIGFVGGTLALLLIAGALLRSRAVPVWLPAVIVLSAVAFFLADSGVLSALAMVPLLVAYATLAWTLTRRHA